MEENKVIFRTLSEALGRRGQFVRTVNIIFSVNMSQKYILIEDYGLNPTSLRTYNAKPGNFLVVNHSKQQSKCDFNFKIVQFRNFHKKTKQFSGPEF